MRKINILFISLLFVSAGFSAYAHGIGGGDEDKVVDGYLIDLSYNPEIPLAGEGTQFTLALLDNESKKIVDFENTWVRILKDSEILFASTLERTALDVASFVYTFFEPGTYEMTVRFQKYNDEIPEIRLSETIMETNFDVVVGGDASVRKSRLPSDLIIGFVIGAVLIGVVVLFFRRKTSAT